MDNIFRLLQDPLRCKRANGQPRWASRWLRDARKGHTQLVIQRFLRKIRPKSDYLKSISYLCDMKSTKEYTQLLRNYRDKNAAKYNITRMGIFGSVARGEQTEDSDVDVYVETSTPNLFALVHIKEELQALFGCSVDLVRLRDHMDALLRTRIEKEGIYV